MAKILHDLFWSGLLAVVMVGVVHLLLGIMRTASKEEPVPQNRRQVDRGIASATPLIFLAGIVLTFAAGWALGALSQHDKISSCGATEEQYKALLDGRAHDTQEIADLQQKLTGAAMVAGQADAEMRAAAKSLVDLSADNTRLTEQLAQYEYPSRAIILYDESGSAQDELKVPIFHGALDLAIRVDGLRANTGPRWVLVGNRVYAIHANGAARIAAFDAAHRILSASQPAPDAAAAELPVQASAGGGQ
jgi:hypothetical protein